MMWRMADPLLVAERALDGVETCLRGRRFSDLPMALAALEKALGGLQTGGLDRSALTRVQDLRRRAGRVGELLRATLAGMRDARVSMATPPGFSSYDAQGRSGRVSMEQSRFERRR